MLIAAALLSYDMPAGHSTPDDTVRFMLFLQIGITLISPAIAWSKIAFAITLLRVVGNRFFKCFLWFIIVSGHLVLISGMLSVWVSECNTPRTPSQTCIDPVPLQALGGVMFGIVSVYYLSRLRSSRL